MNLRRAFRILILASLVASSFSAQALEVSGVKVSGEAVFDYNFLSSGEQGYPGNSGAPQEQYRLSQAQILLTKDDTQYSFLTRLNYLPTDFATPPPPASTTPGANKSNMGTLDQLEIFYKINPELSIGFGRFLTTMGLESLMRFENTLFGNTVAYQGIIPGYGEGLRLKYVPSTYVGVNLSTYNRARYNQFGDDYTPTKTTEVSVYGNLGSLYWFGAHYFGTDVAQTAPAPKLDKTSSSVLLTYKWTDAFTTSLTYDTRSQEQSGVATLRASSAALHMGYTWNQHLFGLRYETVKGLSDMEGLNDNLGYFTGYNGADKLDVITIGDKFRLTENFDLHLEYRMDKTDKQVLKKNDGTATDSSNMITLGAIAHF